MNPQTRNVLVFLPLNISAVGSVTTVATAIELSVFAIKCQLDIWYVIQLNWLLVSQKTYNNYWTGCHLSPPIFRSSALRDGEIIAPIACIRKVGAQNSKNPMETCGVWCLVLSYFQIFRVLKFLVQSKTIWTRTSKKFGLFSNNNWKLQSSSVIGRKMSNVKLWAADRSTIQCWNFLAKGYSR